MDAEYNFNYRDHTHALRATTGLRAWVTQCVGLLAGSVGALDVSPKSVLARSKVTNNIAALDKAVTKANASYQHYNNMDGPTQAQFTTAADDCAAMITAATNARNRAVSSLSTAEAADAAAAAAAATAAAAAAATAGNPPAGAPDPARNAEALKPTKLINGATPATVKRWVRQFKAYYNQLGAARWSVDAGHALFCNNLDKELWAAIERSPIFSETAPILPATPPVGTSLLEILDAHFITENPVFNRRVAWYQISQNQGQTSSLVVSKIREDALLADINNLTFDESCVLRTMCAISDTELLSELRRIPPPITFQKVQDRCIAYDREKKETQSTTGKKAAAATAPATPDPPQKSSAGTPKTPGGKQGTSPSNPPIDGGEMRPMRRLHPLPVQLPPPARRSPVLLLRQVRPH